MFVRRLKTVSRVGAAVIIIFFTVSLHSVFPVYLLEPLHSAVSDSRKLSRNETQRGEHAVEHSVIPNRIPKFQYVISGDSRCARDSYNGRLDIIVVIYSIAKHFEHRMNIRKVLSHPVLEEANKGPKMTHIFLFGLTASKNARLQLQKESREYNDIVISNFQDSYRNLTLKSISMLHWVSTYCLNAKYLIKVDDDMSWNLPALLDSWFRWWIPYPGIIYGNSLLNANVRRNKSKWAVTKEEYGWDTYPYYVSGPAYVISVNAVPMLVDALDQVHFLSMEDVFITGILRKKAGVYLGGNANIFCDVRYMVQYRCIFGHGWGIAPNNSQTELSSLTYFSYFRIISAVL